MVVSTLKFEDEMDATLGRRMRRLERIGYLLTDRTLLVCIKFVLYPITEEILHQVFSSHGLIEKITIIRDNAWEFRALVRYDTSLNAVRAQYSFHGRCIYEGCCLLNIQFPEEELVMQYAGIPEAAAEDTTNEVDGNRLRKQRPCFYCQEPWQSGHKCKPLNSFDDNMNLRIDDKEFSVEESDLNSGIKEVVIECGDKKLSEVEVKTEEISEVNASCLFADKVKKNNLPSLDNLEPISEDDAIDLFNDDLEIENDILNLCDNVSKFGSHEKIGVGCIDEHLSVDDEVKTNAYDVFDKMPQMQVLSICKDKLVDDGDKDLTDCVGMDVMSVVPCELLGNLGASSMINELYVKSGKWDTMFVCSLTRVGTLNPLGECDDRKSAYTNVHFDLGATRGMMVGVIVSEYKQENDLLLKSFLTEMCVKVGLSEICGVEDRLNMMEIKKVTGDTMHDSFLVSGVAVRKIISYAGFENQPKKSVINFLCWLLKLGNQLTMKGEGYMEESYYLNAQPHSFDPWGQGSIRGGGTITIKVNSAKEEDQIQGYDWKTEIKAKGYCDTQVKTSVAGLKSTATKKVQFDPGGIVPEFFLSDQTNGSVQRNDEFSIFDIMKHHLTKDNSSDTNLELGNTTGFAEDYVGFLRSITPETRQDNLRKLKRFNVGKDCPVSYGLYSYQTYTGGFVGRALEINHGQGDISVNGSGGSHHAKKCEAYVFCYVDDIVLAISKLLKVHERVLYANIGIYHDDGVEDAFYTTDNVMTVSFHKIGDYFPGSGDIGYRKGKYYSLNVPLGDAIGNEGYQMLFKPIMGKVREVFNSGAVVLQFGRLNCLKLSIKGLNDCHLFESDPWGQGSFAGGDNVMTRVN